MKIIAFSGAHGTGKTTAMYLFAHKYKKEHPTESITIISEVARTCPMPINKTASRHAQWWIFNTFNNKLIEAQHKNINTVITDRSHYDIIAYTQYQQTHNNKCLKKDINLMLSITKTLWESLYDKIFLHHPNKNGYLTNDGIRDTSKYYQDCIDFYITSLCLNNIKTKITHLKRN